MEQGAIIKHDQEKAPKTGNWRYMKPEVDKEKCIGCGTCIPYCPEAAIEFKIYKEGQRNKVDIDYEYCKGCGVCTEVCPVKAILMKKN